MRYIGSKTKLLEFLKEEICDFATVNSGAVFCDAFTGTCAVGDYFQDYYKIIANDNLYFSYVVARAKLLQNQCSFIKLGLDPFDYFNNIDTSNYTKGYCYNNFAPQISGRQYFSDENAKMIDFVRETIEEWFSQERITLIEHDYLIGCLIESLSKVSNVAGVYAAFLHIWDARACKKMKFIPVESIKTPCFDNKIFNEDVISFIQNISGDILYLDPPYTPTQYISQYHVLETIARNDKPKHHGVGAHRDNGLQISNWSKKYRVYEELYRLVSAAKFNYIALSYSDAGIMDRQYIEALLKRFAKKDRYKFLKVDFAKYKNTRAVNKELRENTVDKKHYEWLFLVEKNENPYYISPLNYIGGKYDVLDFILPLFPKNINTFFDLFGGGGTVSINANARKIVYNDINFTVKQLLAYISEHNIEDMYKYIDKTIKKFELSKGNKDAYIKFRTHYNSFNIDERNPLDLYLLICFGFEHQIRYNKKLEFNNPCGNSGFNMEMLEKLISFSCESKKKDITYYSKNYLDFESQIEKGDFVYCDPPYLLTCGAYNDGKRGFNGWDKEQQMELLAFLDRLNQKGVKFALSNVLEHNNEKNDLLIKWVETHNYNLHCNNKITKRNRQNRCEVLITNY